MKTLSVKKDELEVTWTHLLKEFKNVKIYFIDFKAEKVSQLYFRLHLYIETKKGAYINTTLAFFKPSLGDTYIAGFGPEIKTKELKTLASEMLDVVLDNLEHIHPSLVFTTMISEIKYPDTYIAIEDRYKKVERRKGVTKAEVLAKKEDIISFYEKIKKEDLPERPIDEFNDERRSFMINGPGSKYLIALLTELNIIDDCFANGTSHTIYFKSKGYKSSYLAIMDAWKTFLSSIIKNLRIYIHTWHCL
ncbi:hypothetical protein [Bacillus sp. Brlt_9]|uniref:hypothetical protein n=1 Tax=Bacillus sp. Brlt_9 TaxID=3110916 RepID=UPI003F7BE5E9